MARHIGRAEKAGGGGEDQLDRAGTGDAQHRTIGLDASTLGADACACFERQAAGYAAIRVVAAAHRDFAVRGVDIDPLARAPRAFGVDRSALGAARDDDHPLGGSSDALTGWRDTPGDVEGPATPPAHDA